MSGFVACAHNITIEPGVRSNHDVGSRPCTRFEDLVCAVYDCAAHTTQTYYTCINRHGAEYTVVVVVVVVITIIIFSRAAIGFNGGRVMRMQRYRPRSERSVVVVGPAKDGLGFPVVAVAFLLPSRPPTPSRPVRAARRRTAAPLAAFVCDR